MLELPLPTWQLGFKQSILKLKRALKYVSGNVWCETQALDLWVALAHSWLHHRFTSDLRDSFSFRTYKATVSILKGRSIDTVKVDKSSVNRLSSPTVPGKTQSIRTTNCFPSEEGRA